MAHKTQQRNKLDKQIQQLQRNSHSKFWLPDNANQSSISAYSGRIGELIALNNYRKAIANFVKIVTNKDIPVKWFGDTSYTDGKSITITSNIDSNNFDVVVGLALHEGSHVLLTDFEMIKKLYVAHPPAEVISLITRLTSRFPTISAPTALGFIKSIHNWIEDRRIDHYVFSHCPGYKTYYHTLYDHYWNTPEVQQAIACETFRDPNLIDSWEFHIIGMISPYRDLAALSGLSKVAAIINLADCGRWTSTQDTFDTTVEVIDCIIKLTKNRAAGQGGNDTYKQGSSLPDSHNAQSSMDDQDDSVNDQQQDDEQPTQDVHADQDHHQEDHRQIKRDSVATRGNAYEQLRRQRDFINTGGQQSKQQASNSLQASLQQAASVDMQVSRSNQFSHFDLLVVDYTSPTILRAVELLTQLDQGTSAQQNQILEQLSKNQYYGLTDSHRKKPSAVGGIEYTDAINQGLQLGAILGSKLMRHSDSQSTTYNRQLQGRLDSRRIAHAGYQVESIFQRTMVDQCKPAHIHITLDASGSMIGTCWAQVIKTTTAIAMAATKARGAISVVVDVRSCGSPRRNYYEAVTTILYDSRINKISHLTTLLRDLIRPADGTPEGLCFEAMLKQNRYTSGTKDLDSYLINMSDGYPGVSSRYRGTHAIEHTAKQVRAIINTKQINVLSYFIKQKLSYDGYTPSSEVSIDFKLMYGTHSATVDSDSVTSIATTLNKLLLSSRHSSN